VTVRVILMGGAVALSALAPAHAQEASGELALEIALRTYHVDERVRGSAGDHGIESFQSYVWTNPTLCQVSASDNEPSSVPAIGWHFAGRVIERTGDDFLVAIEWRRLWFNSVRLADGPNGSMQVRMRADRRLELDVVGPLVTSSCGMAGARLEAAIVSRPRVTFPAAGQIVARAGGGRGDGRGGSGGGGRVSGGGLATGPVRPWPSASLDAELWLVHTRPDGTEESQRHAMILREGGGSFTFPPVLVGPDSSAATVEVSVNLRPVLLGDAPGILVGLGRTVGQSSGGSVKTVPLPVAGEVISFELPSLRGPVPVVPATHRFEVRLRMK
jgi:hypothetical protein